MPTGFDNSAMSPSAGAHRRSRNSRLNLVIAPMRITSSAERLVAVRRSLKMASPLATTEVIAPTLAAYPEENNND